MALIYCRECGKQISDSAQSCPSCGAGQKVSSGPKDLGRIMFFSILLFAAIIGGVVILMKNDGLDDSSVDTLEERTRLASEILSKNCDALANMASEYVKKDWAAVLVNAFVENRCDCVTEPIAKKMATSMSLNEIEGLRSQPLHQIAAIRNMAKECGDEIANCILIKRNE